jgi:HrpA-like RNA helicase
MLEMIYIFVFIEVIHDKLDAIFIKHISITDAYKQKTKQRLQQENSDHITILYIITSYVNALDKDEWCQDNGFSKQILESIVIKSNNLYNQLRHRLQSYKNLFEINYTTLELYTRIKIVLLLGFNSHIAQLSNNSYAISNSTAKVNISKSSFVQNKPKYILYHKLVNIENKYEYIIVTKVDALYN